MKKAIFSIILLLFGYCLAQESVGFRLFDFVEKILIEDYVNPRGSNISAVLTKYRAKLVESCKNVTSCDYEKAKTVVKAMLQSFDDGHLGFYDSLSVSGNSVGDRVSTGRFGLWVRSSEKSLFVIDVYKDAPAHVAGIKVGDVIETVNLRSLNPSALEKYLRELEVSFSETSVVVNRQGKRFTVSMRPNYSTFLYPTLNQVTEKIFSIKIYDLGLLLQDQLVHDLILSAQSKGAKGLIFDLRYNEGGTMVTSLKIASAFFSNPSEISVEKNGTKFTFRYSNGQVEWQNMADVNHKGLFEGKLRNPVTFDGAVTVLTTARTLSAGEHLAYLIQAAKRGIVIGEPTAGALDTSVKSKEFTGGGILRYSATRYQNLQGQWLPPRVTPDVTIMDFSSGYASGQDNVLNEAVKRLAAQIK